MNWIFVRSAAAFVGLSVLSAEDIARKEISLIKVILMSVTGIIASIAGGEWSNASILYRFIPGLLVLLLARMSGESIGYGDGWVLLGLGCCLDIDELISLCMAAITCAGIAALFMLFVLHRGRRAQLPFVPFLLIGCVVIRITTGPGG